MTAADGNIGWIGWGPDSSTVGSSVKLWGKYTSTSEHYVCSGRAGGSCTSGTFRLGHMDAINSMNASSLTDCDDGTDGVIDVDRAATEGGSAVMCVQENSDDSSANTFAWRSVVDLYAGTYASVAGTTTISGWTQLNATWTAMLATGFSHTTGALSPINGASNGRYEVDWHATITGGATPDVYEITVTNDNNVSQLAECYDESTIFATATNTPMGGHCIIDITDTASAADDIYLVIQRTAGTTDPVTVKANLRIRRL